MASSIASRLKLVMLSLLISPKPQAAIPQPGPVVFPPIPDTPLERAAQTLLASVKDAPIDRQFVAIKLGAFLEPHIIYTATICQWLDAHNDQITQWWAEGTLSALISEAEAQVPPPTPLLSAS